MNACEEEEGEGPLSLRCAEEREAEAGSERVKRGGVHRAFGSCVGRNKEEMAYV